MSKIFITGTGTGVGKTYVSVKLLEQYNKQGCSTIALKPVASGCFYRDGMLVNEDALALKQAASISMDYRYVNPFALEQPVSPHIATSQPLTAKGVLDSIRLPLEQPADIHIIEGVGGWNAPLNDTETMADFVKLIKFEVIIVVGMTLGCLNHAILTYNAIKRDNIKIKGWIANCIDPTMLEVPKNIEFLKQYIKAPCLATFQYAGVSG